MTTADLLRTADRLCMGRLVFSRKGVRWRAWSATYRRYAYGSTPREALAVLIRTTRHGEE